ncbi:hypothetical protein [Oleiagrimonas sp. MCCC 1A03011]|uniref:hypothetical protein n=1 Tax=Oleiagrimonas sp. MCCC 1A03011 TaxID=1926883 RepID=UPI000DC2D665|nr:hypothetical protein [Oleiagrimonas sp. MCCC 1A03011]RAP57369.1 hypothetical protein BTJ49_09825 [Oleiagrimonas sp. MCCC 1A03011]
MFTKPTSRSLPLVLGLALTGVAAGAMAQSAPTVSAQVTNGPAMKPSPPQPAVYHTRQGTLIVKSSMPAPPKYGPAPTFAALDSNHNGRLNAEEANAYAPLANDFLYVSHGTKTISRGAYRRWVHQRSTTS